MTEIFRSPYMQAESSAGLPVSGAKLYFYQAGTTTEITVYQDSAKAVAHANPVVADASGIFPAIYVDEATYKVELKTAADVTIKTYDNIARTDSGAAVSDSTFRIQDNTDTTKKIAFEASGIATGTTRTLTAPDMDGTIFLSSQLATASEAQTGTSTTKAVTPAGLYYPSGHLWGLTLSNNATDATNDIDIAAGTARDSTDAVNIDLLSGLTKRLDAAWEVGTDKGMLDGSESVAGTPDTSTWYHIWLIKRSDTGVVDVLASESATAPTMPTSYDYKRRIGAVFNDSSGNIRAFSQNGDEFLLSVPNNDIAVTNLGATATLYSLLVPTGIKVNALIRLNATNATAGTAVLFSSPDEANNVPGTVPGNYDILIPSTNQVVATKLNTRTNTSSQIRGRANVASTTVDGATYGWIDRRGRDA